MAKFKPTSDNIAFGKIRHIIKILDLIVNLMLWVVGELLFQYIHNDANVVEDR